MPFLDSDFLLTTPAGRRLYHEYAADQPIYDFHSHLPPAELADNRIFPDLHAAWLAGDHYKWRAMRLAGVHETLITGDADPIDKFRAWAATVPKTLRNPLYHWTHLELQRYFDIDAPLNTETADEIWEAANRRLAEMPVSGMLERFNVALIGTTDDPADALTDHEKLQRQPLGQTTVVPTFRPDAYTTIDDPSDFRAAARRLGDAVGIRCDSLNDLHRALKHQHEAFHAMGCRLSDHGLDTLPSVSCNPDQARDAFDAAFDASSPMSQIDKARLQTHLLRFIAELNYAAGWTMQLHLGAKRNIHPSAYNSLGPDTGFDAIGDTSYAQGLIRLLADLAADQTLPQVILYHLNPADQHVFASIAGSFQGDHGGPVHLGPAWWFLDQQHGITEHLNTLSNFGMLSNFIGMTTDSRSFLSFPRHEYFRRILCGMLGQEMDAGELPMDFDLLGSMVKDLSFGNARRQLGLPLSRAYAS